MKVEEIRETKSDLFLMFRLGCWHVGFSLMELPLQGANSGKILTLKSFWTMLTYYNILEYIRTI